MDSSDSPLVQHLLTSWQPALQPSLYDPAVYFTQFWYHFDTTHSNMHEFQLKLRSWSHTISRWRPYPRSSVLVKSMTYQQTTRVTVIFVKPPLNKASYLEGNTVFSFITWQKPTSIVPEGHSVSDSFAFSCCGQSGKGSVGIRLVIQVILEDIRLKQKLD